MTPLPQLQGPLKLVQITKQICGFNTIFTQPTGFVWYLDKPRGDYCKLPKSPDSFVIYSIVNVFKRKENYGGNKSLIELGSCITFFT